MAIKEVSTTPASTPKPKEVTTPPVFTPKYAGWTKAQTTEEAVNQLMVQKFKDIVAAYEIRKEAKSITDLAKGPFYPHDYHSGLTKHKCKARLDFLMEKNAFRYGLPPKGFDGVKDLTQCYQIQKDVLPTQALENVKDGQFSFFDCGQIAQLAIYETLREVMGDIDFNKKFSGTGSDPLKFHCHITKTPLYKLGLVREVIIDDKAQLHFGDHVFFQNMRIYHNKHPYGPAGGFNTIVITPNDGAEKKYAGFGMPVEGKTEEQIYALLVDELNESPIKLTSILTGTVLKTAQEDQKDQETFYASAKIDINNYKTTIEEFNQTRELSIQQQNYDHNNLLVIIGRYPVVKRLDIQGIHKHLKA